MPHVTVRDARGDRDRSLDTPEGGQVLMEYSTQVPVSEGTLITLPSGEQLVVIGFEESIRGTPDGDELMMGGTERRVERKVTAFVGSIERYKEHLRAQLEVVDDD